METDVYFNFLKKYVEENDGCFLGSHESHREGNPEKIIENGLRVSYSPYSKKSNRFKDENGVFNLEKNFMATMFVISKNNLEENYFYLKTPSFPVIINIPKELLSIIHETSSNDEAYHFFCGYAFEEFPKDDNGCGILIHKPDEKGANVRVLPPYLIAGYYDVKEQQFIENDKHFLKLPQEEQDKIKKAIKEKYEVLSSQNQPQ